MRIEEIAKVCFSVVEKDLENDRIKVAREWDHVSETERQSAIELVIKVRDNLDFTGSDFKSESLFVQAARSLMPQLSDHQK